MLTNNVVSFEQPGPDMKMSSKFRQNLQPLCKFHKLCKQQWLLYPTLADQSILTSHQQVTVFDNYRALDKREYRIYSAIRRGFHLSIMTTYNLISSM